MSMYQLIYFCVCVCVCVNRLRSRWIYAAQNHAVKVRVHVADRNQVSTPD